MDSKYENNAKIFKALSDSNRLQIIHILSLGDLIWMFLTNANE